MATASSSLKTLREQAADCRACPLRKGATQTVFGKGPQHAQLILVGEQPGDREDRPGKPFVGPAGVMLDRRKPASSAGRPTSPTRSNISNSCNAGKSACTRSRILPRSKRAGNGTNAIKPALVVAMGATAAQSVFGKMTPINTNRGRLFELDDGIKAL